MDEVINVEKTEMALISEVDKSGSDIEEYVNNLDAMLLKKMMMIAAVRKKLVDFNAHLQLEKQLQGIYHKKQTELDEANDRDYDGDDFMFPSNYDRDSNSDDMYPQQDSEGMIMGVGPGNSNITSNFAKISSNHVKGGHLLPGLSGDNMDNEGDENLGMDDDNE